MDRRQSSSSFARRVQLPLDERPNARCILCVSHKTPSRSHLYQSACSASAALCCRRCGGAAAPCLDAATRATQSWRSHGSQRRYPAPTRARTAGHGFWALTRSTWTSATSASSASHCCSCAAVRRRSRCGRQLCVQRAGGRRARAPTAARSASLSSRDAPHTATTRVCRAARATYPRCPSSRSAPSLRMTTRSVRNVALGCSATTLH